MRIEIIGSDETIAKVLIDGQQVQNLNRLFLEGDILTLEFQMSGEPFLESRSEPPPSICLVKTPTTFDD